MEIADLPISSSHRAKILAAGYSSLAELSAASPPRLARVLNIVIQEAVDILKVVEGANKLKGAEGPSGVLRVLRFNSFATISPATASPLSFPTVTSGESKGTLEQHCHGNMLDNMGGMKCADLLATKVMFNNMHIPIGGD